MDKLPSVVGKSTQGRGMFPSGCVGESERLRWLFCWLGLWDSLRLWPCSFEGGGVAVD